MSPEASRLQDPKSIYLELKSNLAQPMQPISGWIKPNWLCYLAGGFQEDTSRILKIIFLKSRCFKDQNSLYTFKFNLLVLLQYEVKQVTLFFKSCFNNSRISTVHILHQYSPEITPFELGKLYHSLFCPHFRIQTVAGKLKAGPGRRLWDSRAMMIFKWWREKDKMLSRFGVVAI